MRRFERSTMSRRWLFGLGLAAAGFAARGALAATDISKVYGHRVKGNDVWREVQAVGQAAHR